MNPAVAALPPAPLRRGVRVAAALGVGAATAWGACALAVQLGTAPALLWAAGGCAVLLALLRGRGARTALALGAAALAGLLAGWHTLAPSNDRDWADDVRHLATATVEADGRHVAFDHVRRFTWRADGGYTAHWERQRYDLAQLQSVDLLLSHWARPSIAHTMVSFGFADGRFLVVSLEIRRERHEDFTRLGGFFKQYEAAVIAADERDILRVRTNLRGEDAYRWPIALDAEQRRGLLLQYVDEANALARTPRWYHTVTANCTTIVQHMVRRLLPAGAGLPADYRLVLSGYLPELFFELGGTLGTGDFAAQQRAARITQRARDAGFADDFSQRIRRAEPVR